jgi:hypothetical protein
MEIRKNLRPVVPTSTGCISFPAIATMQNGVPELTRLPLLSESGCSHIQVNSKAIGAVRMDLTQGSKRGLFCQLPIGSVVTVIGSGFNDQTVLVRCGDTLYAVFRQDLGLAAEEIKAPARIS